jgi:primosomal protein N'
MLESQSRQVLHQLLSYAERWLLENRTVEAQIDVDPYEI